jgi:hypothetical protein
MSGKQLIEITVDKDGHVALETTGFAGTGCRDASRAYEEALGSVASDTATAEARQLPPAEAQAKVKTTLG